MILAKVTNYWYKVQVSSPYIPSNVSSISGVHYRDKAKLYNKFHITNGADWD